MRASGACPDEVIGRRNPLIVKHSADALQAEKLSGVRLIKVFRLERYAAKRINRSTQFLAGAAREAAQ